MDPVLSSNLKDIAHMVTQEKWDWLHLNSGVERGGKSSFALQQAWFLSKKCGLNFDWSPELKNVFFLERNLSKKMMGLESKSVAILDEGGEAMFSRDAINSAVKNVIKTLMIYGSRNIFLIINIPNWRWIDRYVRESRVRSMAEIITYPRVVVDGKRLRVTRSRGFFALFNRHQIIRACRHEHRVLGRPLHYGTFKDFAVTNPVEWGWYSAKKHGFLADKSKTEIVKDKVRARKMVLKSMDARVDLGSLSPEELSALGGVDLGL